MALHEAAAGLGPGAINDAKKHDRSEIAGVAGGALGEQCDQCSAERAGPAATPLDRAIEGGKQLDHRVRPGLQLGVLPPVVAGGFGHWCDPEDRVHVGPGEGRHGGARIILSQALSEPVGFRGRRLVGVPADPYTHLTLPTNDSV